MENKPAASLEEILKNIKAFRKRSKMTQTDMAKLLGVSQATISYWEKGEKDLGLDDAMKIAQILGKDIFDKQDFFKCTK